MARIINFKSAILDKFDRAAALIQPRPSSSPDFLACVNIARLMEKAILVSGQRALSAHILNPVNVHGLIA